MLKKYEALAGRSVQQVSEKLLHKAYKGESHIVNFNGVRIIFLSKEDYTEFVKVLGTLNA
jgi:hypothetical protein